MCLGIPGLVVAINGVNARVDVAGAKKEVSLALMDNVKKGDYVIVHAGFAIEKIDEEKAAETLKLISEAGDAGGI